MVGRTTSGGYGWRTGKSLALAMVRPESRSAGERGRRAHTRRDAPRDRDRRQPVRSGEQGAERAKSSPPRRNRRERGSARMFTENRGAWPRQGRPPRRRALVRRRVRCRRRRRAPFPDAPFPVHVVDLGDARAMARRSPGARPFSPVCLTRSTRRSRQRRTRSGFTISISPRTWERRSISARWPRSAKGIMAPQCGLAPGFIGIVGAHLAARFRARALDSARGSARCRSIRLACSATPSTGRPRASSTNISTIAR